ncbi:MAG: methyl-accepting chemotaxis protein, partial [Nitrospirota bacterium]|nr:methyl-accepting chemotaxis protein [Nitrospirota bacterium]
MSTLLKGMNIGPKFAISIGVLASMISLVGLAIIYQQEQDKLFGMLEQRGQLLESQIQITRSYIAQNYVGKLKKSKVGSEIVIAKDHANNPDAIPFPATATREMGEEANKNGLFTAKMISQTPINPANAPKDAFETEAVRAVMGGAAVFSRVEEVNGVLTFRRASADKATSTACIGCHTDKQVGDVLGVLSVGMNMTKGKAASDKSLMSTASLLLGIIMILVVATYLLLRSIVLKPLAHMATITKDIAQGEGDLTKRVPTEGNDEIAQFGGFFNQFIDKLQKMIGKVAHVTDKVASASVELSATAEEISRGTDTLTSRAAQTAAAVEEMNATVSQVAQNSGKAATLAQETVQTAKNGGSVVADTISGMQHLSEAVSNSAT